MRLFLKSLILLLFVGIAYSQEDQQTNEFQLKDSDLQQGKPSYELNSIATSTIVSSPSINRKLKENSQLVEEDDSQVDLKKKESKEEENEENMDSVHVAAKRIENNHLLKGDKVNQPVMNTQQEEISTFNFTILSISPISLSIYITASHPSRIGCDAISKKQSISLNEISHSKYQANVNLTASLVIQELIPDNDYILYCYGSSEIGELSILHSKTMESFHTLPGSFQFCIFEIRDISLQGTSLYYKLRNNLTLPSSCILFDEQSKEIESQKLTSYYESTVVFKNINKKQKYFTQCLIYRNRREVIKTDIVSIDFGKSWISFWKILLFALYGLIAFVLFEIFMRCWQRRKRVTIYDIDDVEMVGLLRRKLPR